MLQESSQARSAFPVGIIGLAGGIITRILLMMVLLLLTGFSGRLTAQHRHVLDDQIDSLHERIAVAPDDTAKINLYLSLTNGYFSRYALRGGRTLDSLGIVQTVEACRALSKKLNDPHGLGHCLLFEARLYGQTGRPDLRSQWLAKAMETFRAANDKAGLGLLYLYKGIIDARIADSLGLRSLTTAIQLAREAGDIQTEEFAIRSIADMDQRQGKYVLAQQQLLALMERQQKEGVNEICYTTDLLAHIAAATGNHKDALRYALASLDYCRKSNDTVAVYGFYQRLAHVYLDLGNYEQSIRYFSRALSSVIPGNSKFVRDVTLVMITNIATCLSMQGNNREALVFLNDALKKYAPEADRSESIVQVSYMSLYYALEKYDLAEAYLASLLKRSGEMENDPDVKMTVFTLAGKLYFQLRDLDKAAWYAERAYITNRGHHSWAGIRDNSLTLFLLDSAKGNYQAAIVHYQEYKRYSDSIQKDIADKHMIELAVQYETDQKNKDLATLVSKSGLQQETIRKGQALRNTMIAASGLLLLLLLLAYSRFRVKQKANRSLEQKQEEINRQNQALEKMVEEEKKITAEKEKLLVEKEWLVKEINHRVKNNLQVVMSLLDTQRVYLKDEAAVTAIHESQHRVHAISLIHKKLYQSVKLDTTIDMAPYIEEVTEYLSDSLDADNRIKVYLAVEPVELDVSQAVPVGLIINEAFTNAVKYAFPGKGRGMVTIDMRKEEAGNIALWISDNGIGLPEGFGWQDTDSLGIGLMQGLTQQIDGQFGLLSNGGLTIKISFKPAKSLK